jgi:Protein of unknown function
MTKRHISAGVSAISRTWAALHLQWRALTAARRAHDYVDHHQQYDDFDHQPHLGPLLGMRRPLYRRLAYVGGGIAGVLLVAFGVLWWRLTSGPLALDLVTPWLASAVEQRLGGGHSIEVGGTQLERDDDGRTALRLRDIVVRARDGTVIAGAPKAEVGLSGASLLFGQVQATRLSLIGATMSIRVDPDGQINVFAGSEQRPIAAAPAAPHANVTGTLPSGAPARGEPSSETNDTPLSSLLAWIDGLDALGLDGRDLTEIGLKNGSLVVDDQRSGKRWHFQGINFSLTRPREGGVAFAITSGGTDGPWSMTATVTPRADGRRAIEAVVRDISPKDILLALRVSDGSLDADIPLSALIRAELAPDGRLLMAEGSVLGGAGFIGSSHAPAGRMLVDEARLDLRWDANRRILHLPLDIHAGANRVSLLAQLQAPHESNETWNLVVGRGLVVLGGTARREPPLVLDRVLVRARFDTANKRFLIEQGQLAGAAAGVAFSAEVDYAGEARLNTGIVATRMTMLTLKRLWPAFVVPKLRQWVVDHFPSGTIEQFEIRTNAPWHTLKPEGPPVPDDGLKGEIAGTVTLKPVPELPAIRDADMVARFTGRTATITLGRGTVDLPSGRKIAVSNGVLEVPDTAVKSPPARVKLNLDGPAEAAAELAAMEPLRSAAGVHLDPATTRGAITAQFSLNLPLREDIPKDAIAYNLDAEVTNFVADKLVRGLKAEASILRINASPQGFRVNGDARIGNAIVAVDYRKRPDGDAEARAQTVLNDADRAYLGFELGGALSGPVPIKFSGRIASGAGDNRFAVDADLTQAKVTDLLPGWSKAAGKAARATFILIEKPQSRRIDELWLEGSGARVKGSIEVDQNGSVVTANFPTFGLSDGDKASVRADRAPDGTLKVTIRGDVYDGRGFVKSMASGPSDPNAPKPNYDLDLDVKVGAVAGFHGEALRGFDLRLSRRAGQIRSFAVNAKIGLDAQLSGDLRGRSGKQVVYIESADAGALFRFTDMYPRIFGGKLWVAMEPPSADHAAKEGVLNISGFAVRGEAALDRVASSAPPPDAGYRTGALRNPGVDFSQMRVVFTRTHGRLSIREGNVLGAMVCATMDGQIDFLRDDVRLRGTFVPACALNSIPGQIPVLGMLMGGPKEGVLAVTYEVVGPPNGMVLRVNPVSAVMPGIFRKIFQFPTGDDNLMTGETGRQ